MLAGARCWIDWASTHTPFTGYWVLVEEERGWVLGERCLGWTTRGREYSSTCATQRSKLQTRQDETRILPCRYSFQNASIVKSTTDSKAIFDDANRTKKTHVTHSHRTQPPVLASGLENLRTSNARAHKDSHLPSPLTSLYPAKLDQQTTHAIYRVFSKTPTSPLSGV